MTESNKRVEEKRKSQSGFESVDEKCPKSSLTHVFAKMEIFIQQINDLKYMLNKNIEYLFIVFTYANSLMSRAGSCMPVKATKSGSAINAIVRANEKIRLHAEKVIGIVHE